MRISLFKTGKKSGSVKVHAFPGNRVIKRSKLSGRGTGFCGKTITPTYGKYEGTKQTCTLRKGHVGVHQSRVMAFK